MIKSRIKRVLGDRRTAMIRSGLSTLRRYPRYAFGGGIANPPARVDLEITYACNARCRMCPLYGEHTDGVRKRHSRERELSTDEIKSILDQCAHLEVKDLTITGGEPFMRRDLCEILGYAKAAGISTAVITNFSVMTPEQASGVVEAGLDSLNLSLDGPEDLHNSIRRVPGMFARIEKNIQLLNSEKAKRHSIKPRISAGCTVSSLNEDCMCQVVEIAARWGIDISFNPIFYSTPAQEAATSRLVSSEEVKPEDWHLPDRIRQVNARQLAHQMDLAQARAKTLGVNMSSRLGNLTEIIRRFGDPHYRDNNKCMYPWYAMRIDPSGSVYPCSVSIPLGNVRSEHLADIWNGEPYVRFRRLLRKQRLFPKCSKCCILDKNDLVCRILP